MIHQLPGSAILASMHWWPSLYIFRVYLLDLWNLKFQELLLHCIHIEYMHRSIPWPTWYYISYQVLLHFCGHSYALVPIICCFRDYLLDAWNFQELLLHCITFSFIAHLLNATTTCIAEFFSLSDDKPAISLCFVMFLLQSLPVLLLASSFLQGSTFCGSWTINSELHLGIFHCTMYTYWTSPCHMSLQRLHWHRTWTRGYEDTYCMSCLSYYKFSDTYSLLLVQLTYWASINSLHLFDMGSWPMCKHK